MKLVKWTVLLLPVLLVALPFALKPEIAKVQPGAETLTIVTSHSEPIKYETEYAFRKYYREKYGRDVKFDWRNVGGTSDIVRYINDRYTARFRQYWEDQLKREWTDSTAKDFRNPKLSAEQNEARRVFLESGIGIGIDLFFGGGSFDHNRFAQIGYGVDCGLLQKHPDWFRSGVIAQNFSGEMLYDPKGRYVGVCLSSFGPAYNPDRFRELQLKAPSGWKDLTDPRLYGTLAIADPSKSGSVNKCFEMILQQAMQETPDRLAAGWEEGFTRIRLIGANARYAADSAAKVVRDISSGASAAGICIDFYGFSESDWTRETTGRERLIYVMPENGTAVSADPVQLLRGAAHSAVAKEFIEFLLSKEGQELWMRKVGTKGGPVKYALLRPAIRRDVYQSIPREEQVFPDYNPYHLSGNFVYQGKWTGRYFNLIRLLIKCTVLEPMDDLRLAWKAIIDNGGPDQNPEAMAIMRKIPVPYEKAPEAAAKLNGTAAELSALRRSWTTFAVEQYREAARIAHRKGQKE